MNLHSSSGGSPYVATTCPHKRTDFRYDLWMKERKTMRKKARQGRFKVELGPQPRSRTAVTVDTSRARSTLDVVRLCLRDLGWREFPNGKRDGNACDIHWHSVHFTENTDIPAGKVNKFPGMVEVVRKVNLGRMCDTMRGLYGDEFDFHPLSWFLPQQFADFSDHVRRQAEKKQRPVFIVKPDEGSQGEGIYLIHEPREYLFNDKRHIVQEYLAKPLLLEGLKFDFRVYVVLTSLSPLEIFICREGLTRFCTIPYECPTNKNIHESFMHLTNYSLNKKSSTYLHTESDDDGSKRTMSSVFKQLSHKGYDVDKIWDDTKKVVVKTIISIAPELRVEYRAEIPNGKPGPSCFQILGFDILLRDDGKPILLEVNANPSLRIDYEHEVAPGITEYIHSPVDEEIKRPLVMDTLLQIAPRYKTRHQRASSAKNAASSARDRAPSPSRKVDGAKTSMQEGGEDSGSDVEYPPPPHKGYGTLEQVYPRRFAEEYDDLSVIERLSDIFIECLGIRGALRLGPTGFRTFTRKCRLTTSGTGMTNAAMDIMYIDLQRRWDHCTTDYRSTGLCFQGFVEAFFVLAKKKFHSESVLGAVEKLLDYAETNIEVERHVGYTRREPLFPNIHGAQKKKPVLKKVGRMQSRGPQLDNDLLLNYKTMSLSDSEQPSNRSGRRKRTGDSRAKGSSVEQSDD